VILEGRVVIGDCGCWTIWSYGPTPVVLRCAPCALHVGVALDRVEKLLYVDKVVSVSALSRVEEEKVSAAQLPLL